MVSSCRRSVWNERMLFTSQIKSRKKWNTSAVLKNTFTRETNRKGGGIKDLPARKSGLRLKKPGAMLQRYHTIGEVLILGAVLTVFSQVIINQCPVHFQGFFCIAFCPYLSLHLSPILHNPLEKAKNRTKVRGVVIICFALRFHLSHYQRFYHDK